MYPGTRPPYLTQLACERKPAVLAGLGEEFAEGSEDFGPSDAHGGVTVLRRVGNGGSHEDALPVTHFGLPERGSVFDDLKPRLLDGHKYAML